MKNLVFKVKGLLFLGLILTLALPLGSVSLACAKKPAPVPPSEPPAPPIRIQFLGHASFLLTSSDGLSIITDPYTVTATVSYSPIAETADIVTVSHEHGDHNNVAAVKGAPEVVRGVGARTVKGIEFKGIATWHDDVKGARRGQNCVICFTLDGVKICHLGDLGHRLSPEQIAEIGKVDILFVPVGGLFTIDAGTATEVCDDLKPGLIIPMHYKTPKVGLDLAGVEDFLKAKQNVKKLNTSIFEFKPSELPGVPEVIVLEPSK